MLYSPVITNRVDAEIAGAIIERIELFNSRRLTGAFSTTQHIAGRISFAEGDMGHASITMTNFFDPLSNGSVSVPFTWPWAGSSFAGACIDVTAHVFKDGILSAVSAFYATVIGTINAVFVHAFNVREAVLGDIKGTLPGEVVASLEISLARSFLLAMHAVIAREYQDRLARPFLLLALEVLADLLLSNEAIKGQICFSPTARSPASVPVKDIHAAWMNRFRRANPTSHPGPVIACVFMGCHAPADNALLIDINKQCTQWLVEERGATLARLNVIIALTAQANAHVSLGRPCLDMSLHLLSFCPQDNEREYFTRVNEKVSAAQQLYWMYRHRQPGPFAQNSAAGLLMYHVSEPDSETRNPLLTHTIDVADTIVSSLPSSSYCASAPGLLRRHRSDIMGACVGLVVMSAVLSALLIAGNYVEDSAERVHVPKTAFIAVALFLGALLGGAAGAGYRCVSSRKAPSRVDQQATGYDSESPSPRKRLTQSLLGSPGSR